MLTYLLSIATCHRNLEVDLPSRLKQTHPPAGWRVDQVCVWVTDYDDALYKQTKNRVYRKAKTQDAPALLALSYRKA